MIYLIQRGGKFYFNRRVPEVYRKYDPRDAVRVSLKTADRKTALKLAIAHNERLEHYWQGLESTGQPHVENQYKTLVDRARLLGFTYAPSNVLANAAIGDLLARIEHIQQEKFNEKHVEAVLGKIPTPTVSLDEVLDRYFEITKDRTISKSSFQIYKWKTGRKRSIANFIGCVGNKPLHELSREDVLKFRDWWIGRLKAEDLVVASANSDFINVKTIICAVADELGLDCEHIFKKLLIKGDDSRRRLPFTNEHIVNALLCPHNLKGLKQQQYCALQAFAETGAGLNELTGLLPEDIVLDAEIPHIIIRARKGRALKTKFRNRTIPLVGFALDAFKMCPDGFTDYRDNTDSLSAHLSRYLLDRNLFPSSQYTVYSLRHSFQDRLLAVNTPDRIQADLMGHKFGRPRYGDGATLAHKLEWMKKIQLKPNDQ